MPSSTAEYARMRDNLLEHIVNALSSDRRCAAAWLGGSLGRGGADDVSDLDVYVVIAESDAPTLCARPWMVAGRTTPARLEFFGQFGDPAIIRDNHDNAPGTGTMTHVTYRENALVVDWILVPQCEAVRPDHTALLIDKVGVALAEPAQPETLEQRQQQIEERVAFFWMMAMVSAKWLVRGNEVKVIGFLSWLHNILRDVGCLIEGHPRHYQPDVSFELVTGPDRQAAALHDVCQRMSNLMAQAERAGFQLEPTPIAVVERLLSLALGDK